MAGILYSEDSPMAACCLVSYGMYILYRLLSHLKRITCTSNLRIMYQLFYVCMLMSCNSALYFLLSQLKVCLHLILRTPFIHLGTFPVRVGFTERLPVPNVVTTYMCQAFDIPSDKDYHLVATESRIDNINIAHHMVIYGCEDSGMCTIEHTL